LKIGVFWLEGDAGLMHVTLSCDRMSQKLTNPYMLYKGEKTARPGTVNEM